jgi:23S rRNA pseudouridine2605 synthase
MTDGKIRLNKALSILGVCSRRDGDKEILAGNVSVNGKVVTDLGGKVTPADEISINGMVYAIAAIPERKVWLYHKSSGLVTSHHDEKGRRSVFDDLRGKIQERVISVGRLDLNSEGLLLITNSGEFARYAETSGWERHYKVRIFGILTDNIRRELQNGVEVDGINYAPLIIKLVQRTDGKNSWVECVLREGKNREIRKLFGCFGIMVNRLIRDKYGPRTRRTKTRRSQTCRCITLKNIEIRYDWC